MTARRTFRFEKCLGRGAYGEVYLCRMTGGVGATAAVAVKVLHPGVDTNDEAVRRLKDEARMLALLDHPCIVGGTDLVVLEGRTALVTEYVDGCDLAECIEEGLPSRPAVEIVGAVARALNAAWIAKGPDGRPLELVHRDVKPHNIRIGVHGDVKLLDFGVARAAIDREAQTMAGTVVGSTLYMAPERFDRNNPVTPQSDIYSLGLTLFEALARRPLFGDMPVNQQFFLAIDEDKHRDHVEKQLGALDVEADVKALTRDLLAHGAEERPTPATVASRCESLAESLGSLTLKGWCQGRSWANAEGVPGKLCGTTLSEDVESPEESAGPATPSLAHPRTSPSHPKAMSPALLLLGGLLVGLGLSAAAVIVAGLLFETF